MSDFIQWLGSRLKKDDSKVGAEETFEAGRKLGKKEGMERAAEMVRAERNDLASPSYNDALDVVGELIRKEIDK